MRFESFNNDPNITKITVVTWSKTKDNEIFPNTQEL